MAMRDLFILGHEVSVSSAGWVGRIGRSDFWVTVQCPGTKWIFYFSTKIKIIGLELLKEFSDYYLMKEYWVIDL